jgi:hypothetical protein
VTDDIATDKPPRLMISYPVPFEDAPLGNLLLPKDLTKVEAERVKQMIDTLVSRP